MDRRALARPFRRRSLSVKLAALGAAVTAAVVWGAFWALSVETRANTRQVFTAQLERNQRTLQSLQERNTRQLLFTASLISRAPEFQYSLKTFQLETNSGGTPSPGLVTEIQRHLDRLGESSSADLLILTDTSGRVFAATRAGKAANAPIRRGTSLAGLAAVQHALDATRPAGLGDLGVVRTDSGYFQVAAYPLVQDGFTLGALLLGQRLDSTFVASARAASDAGVLLTAGSRIVLASEPALTRASVPPTVVQNATIVTDGEEYIAAPVALGVTQDGEPIRLWMLQSLSQRVAALMRPLRTDFLLYGTLAVIIAAVGAALVARTVLGPFKHFVDYMRSGAAAEQRQGQFHAENQAAEVRTLNESFNQLMDSITAKRRALEQRTAELTAANVVLTDEINERTRVEQALRESEAQLRQSQKLEAIGTLAGGIAHDFNNLITVISGYTQLALMRADKGSAAAEDLRQVIDASDRAANLTHQLLAFSRKQVLQPTVLDLGEVVKGISPMLSRIIGEHIELRIETPDALARVRADRGQLEQVLLNLAVNARDAMPQGGLLTISTSNVRDAEPPSTTHVSLVVRDTGTGMTEDVRERIFEPFFTTKEAGKGTGLGLSMVYGIIKQSGGTVAVESAAGKGTAFFITLPAAESVGTGDIPQPDASDLPSGTETVLIVEDADDVRILARRTLVDCGYTVRAARLSSTLGS